MPIQPGGMWVPDRSKIQPDTRTPTYMKALEQLECQMCPKLVSLRHGDLTPQEYADHLVQLSTRTQMDSVQAFWHVRAALLKKAALYYEYSSDFSDSQMRNDYQVLEILGVPAEEIPEDPYYIPPRTQ